MQYIIMCESVDMTILIYVSDCSKTQKMYDKVVEKDFKIIKPVPDCF